MSDEIDSFFEYAKNNFTNFLKKNNVQPKKANGDKENKPHSTIEQLKIEEERDLEHYDHKFKKYLVGDKKKEYHSKKEKYFKKEKQRKRNRSSSSSSSSAIEQNKKKQKHKESEKRKEKKHKHKHAYDETIDIINEYDEERSKYKRKEKEKNKDRHTEEKRRKSNSNTSNSSCSNSILKENKKYDDDDDDDDDETSSNIQPNKKKQKESKQMEVLYPENNKLRKKVEDIIRQKKDDIRLKNALNKKLIECRYCIDSNNFNKMNKLNIVSISSRSYICYYNYKQIFLKDQLFISPIEHTTSITNTNFETVKDIRNHMKCLIAKLETTNETCIFVEFNNCFNRNVEYTSMRKNKHTYINCYVIPNNLLEKAKSYFKKNLEDVNSLYRENKQLIITDNKYAPFNIIPKNIPYISINFALTQVYIQIIENNYDYVNMCTCIFTDLFKQDKLFKYFRSFHQYVNRVEQFKKEYVEYDWTNYIKN